MYHATFIVAECTMRGFVLGPTFRGLKKYLRELWACLGHLTELESWVIFDLLSVAVGEAFDFGSGTNK